MRTWFLLCLLGCDAASNEAVICTANDPNVFTKLSGQRWGACDSNNGLCLQLAADGSYRAVAGFDDYAISDSGRWSYFARDAQSGLVCFDNGSVIDFALTADGLRWDGSLLPAFEPLAIAGSRAALDTIPPSPMFTDLTAHAWSKTNDFDPYLAPTSFLLHRDGTFFGSFRHGECSISGTFSVVYDASDRVALHAHSKPNVCDTRNGGTSGNLADGTPYFEPDGVLRFFSTSYRDSMIESAEQSLIYNAYGGNDAGLVVSATWQEPLASNATSSWQMTLRNPTEREQTVTALRIELITGETRVVLVDRVLQEVLAAGATYATSVDLAFAAGPQGLLIDVTSFDARQSYSNYRSYFVEL